MYEPGFEQSCVPGTVLNHREQLRNKHRAKLRESTISLGVCGLILRIPIQWKFSVPGRQCPGIEICTYFRKLISIQNTPPTPRPPPTPPAGFGSAPPKTPSPGRSLMPPPSTPLTGGCKCLCLSVTVPADPRLPKGPAVLATPQSLAQGGHCLGWPRHPWGSRHGEALLPVRA